MSRENKNYMPQSGAGLMKFNEDDNTSLKLKPEHVVIVSSAIGLGLLLMKFI